MKKPSCNEISVLIKSIAFDSFMSGNFLCVVIVAAKCQFTQSNFYLTPRT